MRTYNAVKLATLAAKKAVSQRKNYATVHFIDGDMVDILVGDSKTLVRNVRVIGGADNLHVGDIVGITRGPDGRPLVMAGSGGGGGPVIASGDGGGAYDASYIVADSEPSLPSSRLLGVSAPLLKFDNGSSLTLGLMYSGGLSLSDGALVVAPGDGIDVGAEVSVDVTDFLGDGLVEQSNNIHLGTPSSITPVSANSVSPGSHTHAAPTAAPANPSVDLNTSQEGDALTFARSNHTHKLSEAISPNWTGIHTFNANAYFKSDLIVDADTLFVDASEDAVYINAGTLPPVRGALTVKPANVNQKGVVIQAINDLSDLAPLWSVLDPSGNDLIILTNEGDLESGSPGFVSGLTGWQISHDGNIEANNIWARGEFHSSVFVADEMHATGGTLVVATTIKVAQPINTGDNVLPAENSTFNLVGQRSWNTGAHYGTAGDVFRAKFMTSDGVGLSVYDVFLKVISITDNNDRDLASGKPGTATYVMEYHNNTPEGWPNAQGRQIPVGTGLLKWASTSKRTGGVLLTSDLQYTPYLDIFTVEPTNPWLPAAIKPRVRTGNLRGVLGLDEQWGIAAGTDLSDNTKPHIIASDQQVSLVGVKQTWWNSNRNAIGQVDPDAIGQNSLFWLGPSAANKLLDFTADGLLKLRTSMLIGPGVGFTVANPLLYCAFDGPRPYTLAHSVDVTSHLGVAPVEAGDIFGWEGKNGKAVRLAPATKNWLINPAFRAGGTSGWEKLNDSNVILSGVNNINLPPVVGGYCMQVQTPEGSGIGVYQTITPDTGLTAGSSWTASFYYGTPWSSGANDPLNVRLRLVYTGGDYTDFPVDVVIPYRSWKYAYVTGTVPAGKTLKNITLTFRQFTDTSAKAYFLDALQLENSPYPTPYHDEAFSETGSMSREASYLTYPTSGTISRHAGTIALWAYLLPSTETFGNWIVYAPAGGGTHVTMRVRSSGSLQCFWGSNLAGSTGVEFLKWVHLAMTYDGSTLRTYIDGGKYKSEVATSDLGAFTGNLLIGAYGGGAYSANGYIDDLIITDYAMTDDQIKALYESNAPPQVTTNNHELMLSGIGTGKVYASSKGLFGQAADGTYSFALSNANNNGTRGGFALNEGDVVFGHNKSGSAAIFWDKSTGKFGFYGNGVPTPQVEVDAQGRLIAGPVTLGSEGISIPTDVIYPTVSKAYRVKAGNDTIAAFYATDYDIPGTMVYLESYPKSGATRSSLHILAHAPDADFSVYSGISFYASNEGGVPDMAAVLRGSLFLNGDLATFAWSNVGPIETIDGWASFTTRNIYVKRIGKFVFVSFHIQGVSNSNLASFHLPYTNAGPIVVSACFIRDNGVAQATPGYATMAVGEIIVTLGKTFAASGGFTSSGTKAVIGQLFFETDDP